MFTVYKYVVTPTHPPAQPVIEAETKIERPRDSVKVEQTPTIPQPEKKETEVKKEEESPIQSLNTNETKSIVPEPLVPEQQDKPKAPIEDETSSEDEVCPHVSTSQIVRRRSPKNQRTTLNLCLQVNTVLW